MGDSHSEAAALIDCLRLALRSSSKPPDIGGCDVRRLLKLADRHQVLALCRGPLERAGVPAWAAERLRHASECARGANAAVRGELDRIRRCLAEAGVEASPFRGPWLAEMLFGDPGAAAFPVLEVVVRLEDVPTALAALGPMRREYFPLPVRQRFSPEDIVIALAAQAARKRWRSLDLVAALSAPVFRGGGIDWTVLLERASEARCLRPVSVGLLLACRFFGVAPPVRMADALLADSAAQEIAERAAASLLGVGGHERPAAEPACDGPSASLFFPVPDGAIVSASASRAR